MEMSTKNNCNIELVRFVCILTHFFLSRRLTNLDIFSGMCGCYKGHQINIYIWFQFIDLYFVGRFRDKILGWKNQLYYKPWLILLCNKNEFFLRMYVLIVLEDNTKKHKLILKAIQKVAIFTLPTVNRIQGVSAVRQTF